LPLPLPEQIAAETLTEQPAAREMAFLLGTHPDVVRTALRTHEPSGVVTFAFRLAHAISSAWETVVVKGEADVEWLVRGCGFIRVLGTCSGLRCGC